MVDIEFILCFESSLTSYKPELRIFSVFAVQLNFERVSAVVRSQFHFSIKGSFFLFNNTLPIFFLNSDLCFSLQGALQGVSQDCCRLYEFQLLQFYQDHNIFYLFQKINKYHLKEYRQHQKIMLGEEGY